MRLRPAVAGDGPELSRIQTETWQAAYRHLFPAEFLERLHVPTERWAAKLDAGVGILVGFEDGEMAGYCSFSEADDPGWGEIRAVYVHPNHQGGGLGSKLLDAGLEGLAGAGFEDVLLWVFDRNSSGRSFYERRGWSLGAPIRLEDIGDTQLTLVRYEMRLRGRH